MSKKPVIVLAYSNDHDAYLDMIVRERKNVYKTLRAYHDKDYIQVEKAEHTSIEDFFEIFDRYNNRISIFHYGGHASGSHLQLEGTTGTENANADGLSQLMGLQEGLQLVFLNGCATYGQVEALLDAGVKSVIATSVAINDVKATEFAEQFYRALAQKASIGKAFRVAKAFLTTKYNDTSLTEVKKTKGLKLKRRPKKENSASEMPWGLYTRDQTSLNWKLPTMAHNKLIVRGGSGGSTKKTDLNKLFISKIFKALSDYNEEIQELLAKAKKKGKMDIRLVRQAIVDSYPAPIGEQLRKLLAGNVINEERLRQLVRTYDVTLRLLTFSMFSQLWDAKEEIEEFTIDEDEIVDFNGFLSLNEENYMSYDYAELMDAVASIFNRNEIPFFVEQMSGFNAALQEGGKLHEAHKFMMEMKEELQNGVSANELTSFCMQAEAKLTQIMASCTFFVSYKLITIKQIEIIKKRHQEVKYKLNNVILDRVTAGVLDDVLETDVYTDDRSVILVKNIENVGDYLNLTPFIIDKNALTGDDKSKIFYYSYTDGDLYHYHFIDREDESLEISEEVYDEIYTQMNQFQETVFGTEDELSFDDDDDIEFSFDDEDDDDDGFELF